MNGAFSLGRVEDLSPDEMEVVTQFLKDVAKAMRGEDEDEIDADAVFGGQ